MEYAKELTYDAIRTLGFAGIGVAYAAVGVAFTRPVRLMKIVNTTNQSLDVSLDGVTDHDIVPANSFTLYDLTTNKVRDEGAFFRVGRRVFVKSTSGVAPTSGSCYAVVIAGA
jgi:hypothetical protein